MQLPGSGILVIYRILPPRISPKVLSAFHACSSNEMTSIQLWNISQKVALPPKSAKVIPWGTPALPLPVIDQVLPRGYKRYDAVAIWNHLEGYERTRPTPYPSSAQSSDAIGR